MGRKVVFLVGETPEELQSQVNALPSLVDVVSIYPMGYRHMAWCEVEAKESPAAAPAPETEKSADAGKADAKTKGKGK